MAIQVATRKALWVDTLGHLTDGEVKDRRSFKFERDDSQASPLLCVAGSASGGIYIVWDGARGILICARWRRFFIWGCQTTLHCIVCNTALKSFDVGGCAPTPCANPRFIQSACLDSVDCLSERCGVVWAPGAQTAS